jgi:hypothetical protein
VCTRPFVGASFVVVEMFTHKRLVPLTRCGLPMEYDRAVTVNEVLSVLIRKELQEKYVEKTVQNTMHNLPLCKEGKMNIYSYYLMFR